MSSRWYPIYKKGNPQLRVFLPNFWMKLISPSAKQPKNIVKFITSNEMTSYDIKNYLEKIYNVGVADVRCDIVEGELKRSTKGYVIKDDDYKVAYVTLAGEQTFEFPDISAEKKEWEETEFKKHMEQMKNGYENFKSRNKERPGIPGWFTS